MVMELLPNGGSWSTKINYQESGKRKCLKTLNVLYFKNDKRLEGNSEGKGSE